ncbi:MAG: hypothetical protein ABGX26_00025 [Nautiliaceae bacterium]
MRFWFFVMVLFFTGCSVKTTPVYAVIKTSKVKVADEGFLKEGFGFKKLIIYKAGSVPIEITLKNSVICINNICMDKEGFIKKYLGKNYPSDFFDKILNKECVRGFFCKERKGYILFKDKKRDILIMIKDIKG